MFNIKNLPISTLSWSKIRSVWMGRFDLKSMDFLGREEPVHWKTSLKLTQTKPSKQANLLQKGNESFSSPIHVQWLLLLVLGRVEHQSTRGEKGGNSTSKKSPHFLPPNRFVSPGWWNGFKTDMSQPSDLNFLPSNENFGGHKMTSTARNVEHQGIAKKGSLKSQIAYQRSVFIHIWKQ